MAEKDWLEMAADKAAPVLKATKVAMDTVEIDIRNVYSSLMEVLGVNTTDERAVIHAVLSLLVKAVLEGKTVDEVELMINELKGLV